jgi:hypothetical protein
MYGATSLVERGVDRADRYIPGGPVTAHAAVAGAALAVPSVFLLAGRSKHPLALAAGGIGSIIGTAATVGLVADMVSTDLREYRAPTDAARDGAEQATHDDGLFGTGISTKTALIGAGLVAGGVGALLLKRRMDAKSAESLAAHMAAGVEPAGTLIPRTTLSKQGMKFVDAASRDASFVKDPIRVYAGLASADTPAERAALALAELERQGGLDRRFLLVASPTGTGWVNNMPIAAAEHYAKGDIASVGLQYSTHASSLSLHRLGDATETNREFKTQLASRIDELHPNGDGPKVLLYGESLGAWSAQRLYGHDPALLDAHHVAGALWAGKPYHSTWSAALRPDIAVDAASLDDLARLPEAKADAMRVLSYAQENDLVKYFNFSSLLTKGPRPTPYDRQPFSIVRFFQGLGDMKNALPTQPVGHYVTRGHDYSGVYAELSRRAFHFDDVRPEQVSEIVGRIAEQERGYAARVADASRALARTSA